MAVKAGKLGNLYAFWRSRLLLRNPAAAILSVLQTQFANGTETQGENMKTQLLIATALVAGLTCSFAAKAAPKAVVLPDLSLNQPDLPVLDQVAANKGPHYKIKGVNDDDDANDEGVGDDSGNGGDGDNGQEGANDNG